MRGMNLRSQLVREEAGERKKGGRERKMEGGRERKMEGGREGGNKGGANRLNLAEKKRRQADPGGAYDQAVVFTCVTLQRANKTILLMK